MIVRTFVVSRELIQVGKANGKSTHRERYGGGGRNAFACIMLQESKRVYPNMVSVHDRSQERLSIVLFEVGVGQSPFFVPG
jgi:hypothetical protein